MIFAGLRGKFLNNNSEPSPSQMRTSDACSCGFVLAGEQDCKYESAFCRLLQTSRTPMADGGQPTLPTGKKKRGEHPRCLMIPSVLICTASATHNSMNSTSNVVKHGCFYSFGNKSQQNKRQQFRLLVGQLTLLGVKALFHIAMVSPVVDR